MPEVGSRTQSQMPEVGSRTQSQMPEVGSRTPEVGGLRLGTFQPVLAEWTPGTGSFGGGGGGGGTS